MLNKPTNVSPYNEFIDINNMLKIDLTLNNVVDAVDVGVYSYDNRPIVYKFMNNNDMSRKFSYTFESSLSYFANGNDYFWKARYWKVSPEKEILGNYHLINYDRSNATIGINPFDTPLYSNTLLFNLDLTDPPWVFHYEDRGDKDILEAIETAINTENKMIYAYFYKKDDEGNEYYGYARILGLSFTFDNLSRGRGTLSVSDSDRCFFKNSKATSLRNAELYGSNFQIFEFTTDAFKHMIGACVEYNFGFLSGSRLYKINSLSTSYVETGYTPTEGEPHKMPVIALSLSSLRIGSGSALLEINKEASGASFVNVYNAEYNESPPYYFSCRETPLMNFYDVSTSTPQIRMCVNFKNYIDINSYFYRLSVLKDNNKWELLWESNKMDSVNVLEDGSFDTEIAIYNGIVPNNTYKATIIGQTTEGMDFETDYSFVGENFTPTQTKDFVSFNKDIGCVEIDNSKFTSFTPTGELQIYRYDMVKNELNYVSSSTYDFNTTTESGGLCKRTITYDFNVMSDVEYIYYAFVVDNDNIISSYVSNLITPSWDGVYVGDVTYTDSSTYTPDHSSIWFLGLNFESSEITRNYQISHPHGVGQKYPKSVRGNAKFKTGEVSGLIGKVSCVSGEYEEDVYLIEKFDSFCANGKSKLLRSSTKGGHLIADIDKMSSSEFGRTATSVSISYTQIDDTVRKKISLEV